MSDTISPPAPAKPLQLDLVIERYVQLRDKKAQLKAELDKTLGPINEALDRLEAAILNNLQSSGAESFKTKAGTAYISRTVGITTADKAAFKQWLHETDEWDLADIRPAKVAIEEFRKKHDDIPPGLNWREAISVGVRRA